MAAGALERSLQKQITDALRLELGPPRRLNKTGVMWWGIDISNSASVAPGARHALGIGAGIPDLTFLHRAKTYFQEVKRPDGIVSEEQAVFLACARLVGAEIAVCVDAFSCLRNLDDWGLPRLRRIIFPLENVT